MARDLRLPLREAIVLHLRQDATLTALVPASAIHGERVPAKRTKPYIAMSRMDVEAFSAQCVNGGRIPVDLNIFADGEDSETITKISAAVVASLDDAQLELDEGWCFDITFIRTTSVSAGTETTSWHDRASFTALTGVGD
jgi:hypothetical protein